MNAIIWPESYLPGTTDNYCSNEVIIPNLKTTEVWPFLNNTNAWPQYYENASEIIFYDNTGPELRIGARFCFITFGFLVESEVVEYVPPVDGHPARVAWHGWVEGDDNQRLDVHHAWLIEDLPGNRVRVLTQETQIGKPAKELASTKPNPMINAHQDWLDGLVAAAQEKTKTK
ncbi:hypothetical protein LVD17_25810 [Fulvivirga ulvae]|uniref:hypothetical protein n=1 Tax=Fulvivirga ulvae TaxID=2904245 RepID=UPI001F16B38A|nr:hypothetical protein [Fulvivirga ulvae]UII31710.1 hypothetical protein LVD17_25810 [Fulvivirga ulvae]